MDKLATISDIPVLAAPLFDPGLGRIEIKVPPGLTIMDIINLVLPGIEQFTRNRLRVLLVTDIAAWVMEPTFWHRIKPREGARVVIRLISAGDDTPKILTVVVALAATIIAPYLAPLLLPGITGLGLAIGTTLIATGLTFLGNTLINSIFPSNSAGSAGSAGASASAVDAGLAGQKEKPTYQISGFRNEIRPGAPLPSILGRIRIAPVFAMPPYTEIVGDEQYVRAKFINGIGRLKLSDFKFGDTPVDRFEDVTVETREGLASDLPGTLVTHQVLEERHGAELVRPFPTDGFGDIVSGSVAVEKPVSRFTASDATRAAIIIGFPAGLVTISDTGEKKARTVVFRIREKLSGAGAWINVANLTITSKKAQAVYRQHEWLLPQRGRYEIEVTRLTDDAKTNNIQDRSILVVLQSIRPEYPINSDVPLSITDLRAKATSQLNQTVDNFNLVVSRVLPDWNGNAWVSRETRTPASAFRQVLQGVENAKAVGDEAINLPNIENWQEFCLANGLTYDRNHDFKQPLADTLAQIAAAGRAAPRYDGKQWSVIIDRPDNLVIDHVNSRNARSIKWTRNYPKPPDALRIPFLDETNNWAAAERVVPWPGHAGDIIITEELLLPGKTNPDEIWIEARRRQYELTLRVERYQAIQDGTARTATRGDLVKSAFSVLTRTDAVMEVTAIRGRLVTFSGTVTMEAGKSYAIAYKVMAVSKNLPDDSLIAPIVNNPGERQSVVLQSDVLNLEPGAIVHFGEVGSESLELYITGIETGENGASVLKMVPAAPEIDTFTDAEVPPAWDGRSGTSLAPSTTPPAIPRIVSLDEEQLAGSGNVDLHIGVAPALNSGIIVFTYTLFHRLVGATPWTQMGPTASAGASFTIGGYQAGDSVEIEILATSVNGYNSARSATVTHPVTAALPAPGEPPSGVVVADKGFATITFTTPGPDNFETLIIHRSVTFNFATATKLTEFTGLAANSTSAHIDGDALVVGLVSNGKFEAVGNWIADANWIITPNSAGGVASHTAGLADDLSQAAALPVGGIVRGLVVVSGMTAGSLDIELTGSTTVNLATISANGNHFMSGTVLTGNTTLNLAASSDFDGDVLRVVLFEPSSGSLAQDTWYYWATAANSEGTQSTALYLGAAEVI